MRRYEALTLKKAIGSISATLEAKPDATLAQALLNLLDRLQKAEDMPSERQFIMQQHQLKALHEKVKAIEEQLRRRSAGETQQFNPAMQLGR